MTANGVLQLVVYIVVLPRPRESHFGAYMARIYEGPSRRRLGPPCSVGLERLIYPPGRRSGPT